MTTQRARTVGHMESAGKRREIAGPKAGFTSGQGSADEDWFDHAACRPDRLRAREIPTGIFFPLTFAGPDGVAQVEQAKSICVGECPVRAECLRFAVDSGSGDGVFGGLTPDERRAAKRRAARKTAGA